MNKSIALSLSQGVNSTSYQRNDLSQQQTMEQKIINAREINKKLHQLFDSLKNNTHIKTLSHSPRQSIVTALQPQQTSRLVSKFETQVQHFKHLQNLLLSQNKKLKQEVNNRRKERVIYSNIFKKYEKDIRVWEFKFKEALLDSLATGDADLKIREKVAKIKRKVETDLKQLDEIRMQKQAEQKMKSITSGKDTNIKDHNISKRNLQGGESHKRLVSQKRIQLKTKQLQAQYEKQSKIIMYESLAQQLTKISDTQDLNSAIQMFKTIDIRTEQIYEQYKDLQKGRKQKQSKIHQLHEIIKNKEAISALGTSKLIQNKVQSDLKQVDQAIKVEKQRIIGLENTLSSKLDINIRRLETQNLKPFIERVILCRKENQKVDQSIQGQLDGENSNQNRPCIIKPADIPIKCVSSPHSASKSPKNLLQKRLQQISHQKSIDAYLLSYNEINKSMLKAYTKPQKKK